MAIELTCGKPIASHVSKAEPRYRREQRRASKCIRTVFENGIPVLTEEVQPIKAAASPVTKAQPKEVVNSAVWVNGETYRSTYAAFVALGLPENKHVKFRAQLKRDGANTFVHEGKTFSFEARIPTSGSSK